MSIDLDAVRAAGRRAAEMPAAPPQGAPGVITRASFGGALVGALDQSLGGCALVVLDATGPTLDVMRARMFKTDPGDLDSGTEANYERAAQLGAQLDEEFTKLASSFPGIEIVHEAPPVGGGKFVRPESSLMAGREVRRAARTAGLRFAGMIAPQAHKRALFGDHTTPKTVVRARLPGLFASVGGTGYNLVVNEDERDALCLALAHLLHRRGPA